MAPPGKNRAFPVQEKCPKIFNDTGRQWHRRFFALIFLAGFLAFPQNPAFAANDTAAFSQEEYARLILSKKLNSLTAANTEKRKTQMLLEEASRQLTAFKNKAQTPDSRSTDFRGNTTITSNATLRREGETEARKTEERIRDLRQQMAMIDARIFEFNSARERGFIPIKNVTGQEVLASPVGFRNGEIQFITQDANLTLYSFPIDDINYASLTEVLRFLNRHLQDGSFLLDDILRVNEKAFFEKLARLDININAPKKKDTGQFIATTAPKNADDATRASQLNELATYKTNLEKQEPVDGAPVLVSQLENDAARINSPALHNFLAQHFIATKQPANLEKARNWANRAAKEGFAPAFVTLGNLDNKDYLIAAGFPEKSVNDTDYRAAREWYEKATESRDPGGYWALGKMYLFGIGVPKNDTLAADYIRQAALISDPVYAPQACFMLGILYYQGRGVEKDHEKSIWWLRACANINPESEVSNLAKKFLSKNTFEVQKK